MAVSKKQLERAQGLGRLAILSGLTTRALDELAAECRWSKHPAGQQIISYLAPSADVFFLIAGRVRAAVYSSEGKPVHFTLLQAPAVFGEIAAIDRGPRSAAVEALAPCTVGLLSADRFENLLLREHSVAIAVLRHLTAEVRRLSNRVLEFSTLGVRQRIHGELLRLAVAAGGRDGAILLSPAPSLLDIASRISTHREAVSRELSRLSALGIIKRERGDIRIADIGRLRSLVQQSNGEHLIAGSY